jgi:hypothetical protein
VIRGQGAREAVPEDLGVLDEQVFEGGRVAPDDRLFRRFADRDADVGAGA